MDIKFVDILLIEDNPIDAEMIIRTLRKNKITNNLFHISDGSDALDFLFGKGKYTGRELNNLPKVILLDLKLPKVNGLEVLRKIKTDEIIKKIPVVVLTSSIDSQDMKQSYELGANSYIVKPVEFENFFKAISDLGFYWMMHNEPSA